MRRAFSTPEKAALAEWDAYPEAGAFVVRTEYRNDDDAVVITDTDPSHPMHNFCRRMKAGWICTGDYS